MQMLKVAIAVTLAAIGTEAAASSQGRGEAVQVMVLGTYHFANPGRDVVNVETESVLTPARQKELQVLADTLAEFEPTRIVVEQETEGPGFEVESYRDFGPQMLATTANERVQIGYRLAHRLGHSAVYGFDEHGDDGEPDYFPFGAVKAYAEEHGKAERIDAALAPVRKMVDAFEAAQASSSIPELLQAQNRSDELRRMHGLAQYGLLPIGDGERQPGAELNAYWYMRNAKMFAKLALIARPGDRVLVVVGSGHKYWLDHFAGLTPGYERVDPMPYLQKAAARLEGSDAN